MTHTSLPLQTPAVSTDICSLINEQSSIEPAAGLGSIAVRRVNQLDRDQEFWWRATGIPLATLLAKSGYPLESQWQNLLFYLSYVVPLLGPRPDQDGVQQQWKSFMTDHFSPVELSWEWGSGMQDPVIRFSFEPISRFAGTVVDPLNCYAAAWAVSRYQSLLPDCDLRLYDHFSEALLSYSPEETGKLTKQQTQGHKSRVFLAFDLCKDSTVLKAYFMPTFKAAEAQVSTIQVIVEAIRALPASCPIMQTAQNALVNFVDASQDTLRLQAEIFAIDCVTPHESRLKIYMRSPSTSWQSVRMTMTMDGELETPAVTQGLEELKLVWQLVLGLDPTHPDGRELPCSDHRTAGVLYYFELRPGKPRPGVKLYIPIKHYGHNDLAAAEGLTQYLESVGKGNLASRYFEAIGSFTTLRSLRAELGVQTYLGCSLVGDQLKMTSYLAPKVFQS